MRRTPSPFLKWAGGKRQLLPHLLEAVGRLDGFGRYYEPFLGAGALFFALHRQGLPQGRAALSDRNPRLMEVWQGLQQHVEEVIRELETHKREHSPEHYLQVRAELPESLPARAGRFIYLNRTCYNGLYRENRAGQFNVPMGRYRNPKILNEAGLRAVSQSLQGVSLRTLSFQRVIRRARRGDLVYFDPPYQPISPTASFTAYSRHPFGETEQEELAAICARLQERGVHVMISNSWTPYTRELYPTLQRQAVQARRSLSREGNSRSPVSELLATSW